MRQYALDEAKIAPHRHGLAHDSLFVASKKGKWDAELGVDVFDFCLKLFNSLLFGDSGLSKE